MRGEPLHRSGGAVNETKTLDVIVDVVVEVDVIVVGDVNVVGDGDVVEKTLTSTREAGPANRALAAPAVRHYRRRMASRAAIHAVAHRG
jgi:hypothetical protein